MKSEVETTMESREEAARDYKNNVFIDYIGTIERLIEVYNAVHGTNYSKDTNIEINTLKNVFYRFMQNDVSFVIDGKLVVLVEHQSTRSNNLPIRFLEYITKVYEHMIDSRAYYKKSRLMLPRPEFIVFYNGKEEAPEKEIVNLSESYYEGSGVHLELDVTIYNINRGMNREILEKSRALYEYATLTSKVREYEESGYTLEEAIEFTIKYCLEHDIMNTYLERHGSEIRSLLVHDYSFEEELEVAKEEAEERGLERGREEGEIHGHLEDARRMKSDGMEAALITKYTGLSIDEIAEL
jgi:predicted transposase/invertase (TIGR01784 family)